MDLPDRFRLGPYCLEPERARILLHGRPVRWWSRRRFELLKMLFEADGEPVRYDDLVERVWREKDVTIHTVNKTANDLRRCLGLFGDCIRNERGVGFSLVRPTVSRQVDEARAGLDLRASTWYGIAVEEWNRRTEGSLQRALGYFRNVLVRYPEFVPALLGSADCLMLLGHGGFPVFKAQEILPEAKTAISRALALANDNKLGASAHAALGKLNLMYEWDWGKAEENFRMAISLDQDHPAAYHGMAHVFLITNRWEKSLEAIAHARMLAPTSPMIHSTSGWLRYFTRRPEEAVQICLEAVALHPDFAVGYSMLAVALQGYGKPREAISAFCTANELEPAPYPLAGLGHIYGTIRQVRRAQAVLGQLDLMAKQRGFLSPYFFALVYAGLDKAEQALDHLAVAADQRFDWLIHLAVDQRWEALYRHRRFKEVLKRVGLFEFWKAR